MAIRNRRARLLALALFLVFAFALYSRSGSVIKDYTDYAGKTYESTVGDADGVGGGAVLREKFGAGEDRVMPEELEAGHNQVLPGKPEAEQDHVALGKAAGSPGEEALHEAVTSGDVLEETSNTKLAAEITSNFKAAVSISTIAPIPTLDPLAEYELATPQQGLPASADDDEAGPVEMGQGRVEVDIPHSISSKIHWTKLPEHFPVTSTIQLPTSSPSAIPKIQHPFKSSSADKGADLDRLAVVKAAAVHAWYGYREKAWGQDEIRPVSGKSNNPFNAWGATLVDALDTLWIMDMHAEFEEAVDFVRTIDFTTSPRSDIPLFETTIRYLGGLIAAYDISGAKYRVLLDKAVELADVLYGAFDTPNRMPQTYYRWKPAFASQPHRSGSRVVLAELGSLSMEFTRLAQLTGEPKYYDAIARITDAFDEWQDDTRLPGMWPTYLDASGCGKPAQLASGTGVHMMTHDGIGDMRADSPVGASRKEAEKAEARKKTTKEEEAVNKKLKDSQRKLAEEGEARKLGGIVGKIEGFGETSEEQEASYAASKVEKKPVKEGGIVGKIRVEDDSLPPKHKRQLDGVSTDMHSDEVLLPSNATLHQESQRHPPTQQPQTGAVVCLPQGLASSSKRGSETFTLAGMSDSTYEYLPKMHLLLGARTAQYQDMYIKSAKTAIDKLLYRPMTNSSREILVAGDLSIAPNTSSPAGEMIETFKPVGSHLVCFAGGMFALGGRIFDRPEDVEIGRKLTDGCVWAYNVTATGIMAEEFTLSVCKDKHDCEWDEAKYWAELDPFREQRTKPHTPQAQKTSATRTQTSPAKAKAETEAETTIPALGKRQLPDDHLPNLPVLPEHSSDLADDATAAKRLPPARHAPPAALYTPPPPLSHAEFVAKKIDDERLPPGFIRIASRSYILRPEAIESVFYMYRITGDEYWRERGWEMFVAVQDHTRTVWGNSAVDDVTKSAPELKDSEESFWLAETLKYFYLLFDEPERLSLDNWVLNTEAHFFKIPGTG